MLNSEKIAKNLSEASQAVGENTIDVINSAVRALEKIEEIEEIVEKAVNEVLKKETYIIKSINSKTNH